MDTNARDNAQSALTHFMMALVAGDPEAQKRHFIVGAGYTGRLLHDARRWFVTQSGDPGSSPGLSGFDCR